MIKVVYSLLSAIFFAAGFVGLALPVIPQVPFFIIGAVCLMHVSKKFAAWVKNSRLYREYAVKAAARNRFMAKVLEFVP